MDDYDARSFRWIRISFAKHELEDALILCSRVKAKGYMVQFNPMDAISYQDEEREYLIRKVNEVKPECLSIVDTFGAMHLDDLRHIFDHVDGSLDKKIQIGLHSHDNLGLSCAMAEMMVEMAGRSGRDIIIDGSLFGMGRGAGNAKTELLADFVNERYGGKYNVSVLVDIIERYIHPLKSKIFWGYDLPMFICGTKHSHVDNIYYLRDKMKCSAREMFEIIGNLSMDERIRYGANYSKTDFSAIHSQCDRYRRENKL